MKDPYGEQEVSRYNMPVASRQWLMDLLESHGQPLTLDALVELTGTPQNYWMVCRRDYLRCVGMDRSFRIASIVLF